MNPESHRELRVLEAVAANGHQTQRALAAQLGMALGLTNLCLKQLAGKGHIRCVHTRSNRVEYLITEKGAGERERLAQQFMSDSLHLYRGIRQHLREVLRPCAGGRVAIYGKGDAAELAFLSVREHGLEPVAILAKDAEGTFLGITVRALADWRQITFDCVVVATFENPLAAKSELIRAGVPAEKVITLTPALAAESLVAVTLNGA
jgi:DNA-binding MarR family transcriptional regulator